ncbi:MULTISPECIES: DUF190 domain-containing protein [Pseudomonadota]|uniref:Uncharacterized protein n=1 Tax=Xanthomonas arboricola TaxID=56448 RepID=A0A2S6YXT2_9XANT|nr:MULTISPECIES: DUF190 domain-containing protein [Pseudomonadota]MBB3850111.1 PII-like signaling protein [Xanthomonas arboricola]PPT24413.1 hypothetical protein XarbCFBP7629_04850 [Xanthomonas arboricola]PPT40126.1 hypothetical protein XarjCFBP7653_09700 [Xanthomonas arboricola]PPT51437.1 hypothetical protein XarjCFBP7652_03645 [Xanthomonas arboricola]PPU09963.1 hypothetical protein XarjCFBP7645_00320 [Xanthomonas arboricola]
MHGYQVTFYTQQDRMHGSTPLAQWLLDEAKKLGIRGATLDGALQGLGHDGTVHAINMFDFSDQPVQVTMVLTTKEVERLFSQLDDAQVRVFYTKIPAEFGTLGKPD